MNDPQAAETLVWVRDLAVDFQSGRGEATRAVKRVSF